MVRGRCEVWGGGGEVCGGAGVRCGGGGGCEPPAGGLQPIGGCRRRAANRRPRRLEGRREGGNHNFYAAKEKKVFTSLKRFQ